MAAAAEIAGHVVWWNACPAEERARLLRAAMPVEAAAFVALSNALEAVPTLSAADTLAMTSNSAPRDGSPASAAAWGTFTAHRLAHAFRRQRASAAPADELLWHLPQVLAVHRELLRGLHRRAGRLRDVNVQPADRAVPYLHFAAVPQTVTSFFDVFNARVLDLLEGGRSKHGGGGGGGGSGGSGGGSGGSGGSSSSGGGLEAEEEDALDADGALCVEECQQLLDAPAVAPCARDIDAALVGAVAQLAAWAAAHLLEIHPFADGNGRLARVLIDALLAAVHPVPVPLVPEGCSVLDARARYLQALRQVPPWGAPGAGGWSAEPMALTELVLGSLVASWRRLDLVRRGLRSSESPFLGVLALSARAPAALRRARYASLGHAARLPAPPAPAALEAEADALPAPQRWGASAGASAAAVVHAPTGHAGDGWLHLIWLP